MAEERYEDELIKTRHRKKKNRKSGGAVKGRVSQNSVKVDFRVTEKERNRYYLAAAGKYRAARYLTVIILFVFLLVMLLFFRESITYSNLMYLVRDLDADVGFSTTAYNSFSYDGRYVEDFALFKGRIAVAGTDGLTMYDSSGSREAEYNGDYTAPRLETGEKYALLYDAGEKNYSLYTSVSKVLSSEAEENIEAAAVSDSGTYALLTHSKESKFLVTVYNSAFKAVTKYYKDKYVTDIALDSQGDRGAIVSAFSENAVICAEVTLCEVGSEKTQSFTYGGLMPLSAEYTDDGTLIVACDTAILAFGESGEKWRYDFNGSLPSSCTVSGNTVACACAANAIGSVNTVLVFDTDGTVRYNVTLEHKVSAVATDSRYAVYAAGDSQVSRIDLSDGGVKTESLSSPAVRLLAPEGCLVVCHEDGTGSYFSE